MIDLDQLENDSTHQTDICIVGTGVMGLALANEFLGTPAQVLMLESGGWNEEPQTQKLYELVHLGIPLPNVVDGRFRLFGGNTLRWGGQALPFFPIDLARRDWVAHSGWPITYSELARFYARAGAFMQIDALNYDTELFSALSATPPTFDSKVMHYHFSKWARQPNLRLVYGPRIQQASNIHVMLHANVADIVLNEDQTAVDHVVVQSLSGKRAKVFARTFILAIGAIETARILLACNKQAPCGIGNEADLVGRFFQEHPTRHVGCFAAENNEAVQKLFHLFYRRGLKYSVRYSADESLLREQKLLNATGGVAFETADDSPYLAIKRVARGMMLRQFNKTMLADTWKAVVGTPTLARPIYSYLVKRRGYAPSATCKAWVMTEQEPNPDSRITLSDRRDALGMPLAEVNWQVTYASWRTLVEYARIIQEQFAKIGLRLELAPEIDVNNSDWRSLLADSLHHIGTARMAQSPTEGVVDSQCRVFNVANLYISGSAIFPTSGHSNPTLTALALAIRLTDYIKSRH